MSDVEEPPTKMSKYEEYLEPEVEEGMEEGQEEWLSEGVLTDDDYNPNPEQIQSEEPSVASQEDVVPETVKLESADQQSAEQTATETDVRANIEETLNSLDSTRNGDDLPDDLDAFLIRKTDNAKVNTEDKKDETAVPVKQEADDGNDTDDLLRMLGDGDQKLKKKIKLIKKLQKDDQGSSDDDDDFVYERTKVKTLKLAKNALMKRTPATKAEPEEMSDGDDETEQSSDEGATVQRMFDVAKKGGNAKETPKRIVKHVVQVNTNFTKINNDTSNLKQQKSILKPQPKQYQKQVKSVEVKTPAAFKPLEKKLEKKSDKETTSKTFEFDEIINEAEFLDEEEIDLDEEEFAEASESEVPKQRIMKPEKMDEEVPSDADSHSENGSLYDELPSSESEDMDDWFTLDIRAERAGDYLPLLGTAARSLLIAERRRVSLRVGSLRHSLAALTHSARRQADQLRAAAMALAEIDDTLRAA
ncbi:titin homolog [Trichoplusia ni]|uniref:Titin homolog n=1 Tax=Trichoplusia ni TaxID=7111 RepID=A0A7E5VBA9_TRINI|nr:titin homolog [Trichoplusia ni]